MYAVVRADLKPGYQAVQAAHALLDFSVRYPAETKEWNQDSNYLCILEIENEAALKQLALTAEAWGCKIVEFREPDIGNELTAIALEPGPMSKFLTRNLKLALR